ncbi:MAG: 6-pyruvoyl tetrahydropterin synthase family protein, partial [Candidatus Hodarchaeota archaeon]
MPILEQNFSHVKNSFSACHFLVGFEKCERLHGHNYTVTINLRYSDDDLSSAIDFRLVNAAIQRELKQLNQKILLPEDSSV